MSCFFLLVITYESESKVVQYFANLMYISAALDTFVEVMMVKIHTVSRDVELSWYCPSATHRIYL